MKNTIYVVSHKPFTLPSDKLYKKIYVGNNRPEEKNAIQDNTGDNIAKKNPNYCELTAIYWVWKNDKTSDNIGISHYRRYFSNSKFGYLRRKIIDDSSVEKYLKKYNIIAPMPMYIRSGNVLEQFAEAHHKKDLLECGKIIDEIYPEYSKFFKEVLKEKQYSQFNMLITNRELFSEYHKWLFNILFEAEKRIDISKYDDYNKRLFGFLSERLFNVWIKKEITDGKKIKFLPVISIEEDINPLKKIFRIIRYNFKKAR